MLSPEHVKGEVDRLRGTVEQSTANLADGTQAKALVETARDRQQAHETEANAIKADAQALDAAAATLSSFANLDAVKNVLSGDVKAVFVYDTSKDSDGGAWRHRCEGKSWYNEGPGTYRGARKDFPAVAVIVANASNVYVYDGDDPTLPLWMHLYGSYSYANGTMMPVHAGGAKISCATMLAGLLLVGSNNDNATGLSLIDFIQDRAFFVQHGYPLQKTGHSNIANRHQPLARISSTNITPSIRLASNLVNDVAVTVLPDAPIDPRTGLPRPTIAVATDGGVSVIKHDGTVSGLGNYATAPAALSFVDVGNGPQIYTTSRYRNWQNLFDIPESGTFNTGYDAPGFQTGEGLTWADLFDETRGDLIIGTNWGVSRTIKDSRLTHLHPTHDVDIPIRCLTTPDYTTGWMPGDIQGAYLASTDPSDVVEELVLNDTFDEDIAGWGIYPSFQNGTVFWENKALKLTNNGSGSSGALAGPFSVKAGEMYRVSYDKRLGGYDTAVYISTNGGSSSNLSANAGHGVGRGSTVGSFSEIFLATADTLYVGPVMWSTDGTGVEEFDNIRIERVDHDRSVKQRGLLPKGTIKREPVAPGAELMAYSGFTANDYLMQPNHAALDLGTGDFCFMGWGKNSFDSDALFSLHHADGTGNNLTVINSFAGSFLLFTGSGPQNSGKNFGAPAPLGPWFFFFVARKGGEWLGGLNGQFKSAGTSTGYSDLGTGADLLLGRATDIAGDDWGGSLALFRHSKTVPTATQIAKIYRDEKPLFEPGAKCTLYGDNSAVQALAHDDSTKLLHVGTPEGRSTFRGLRRVEHKPGNTQHLAASGGILIEG